LCKPGDSIGIEAGRRARPSLDRWRGPKSGSTGTTDFSLVDATGFQVYVLAGPRPKPLGPVVNADVAEEGAGDDIPWTGEGGAAGQWRWHIISDGIRSSRGFPGDGGQLWMDGASAGACGELWDWFKGRPGIFRVRNYRRR